MALLDDILTVVLGTDLPTLSSKRTQTLAMWILQVQRLPFCVLSSHSHRLVMALKRAICNEIGKQQAVLDGLKVLRLPFNPYVLANHVRRQHAISSRTTQSNFCPLFPISYRQSYLS